MPGAGTFFCLYCGSQLSLLENDALPKCPTCGGATFRRDSIFEPMQEHGQTLEFAPGQDHSAAEDWISATRKDLSEPGRYLAMADGDGSTAFPIGSGWTRVGRSANADIRLDDPSVSRRHALIVSEMPSALRVLDDRSLNGVHVNGERVEWSRLGDGDELAIGRFILFVFEV